MDGRFRDYNEEFLVALLKEYGIVHACDESVGRTEPPDPGSIPGPATRTKKTGIGQSFSFYVYGG